MFIVLEHIDGAGGTTQAKALAAYLKDIEIPVEVTAEPTTESKYGRVLRLMQRGYELKEAMDSLALKEEDMEIATLIELLYKKYDVSDKQILYSILYTLDRAQHIRRIKSLLNRGTWVICDRYKLSSLAYQGIAKMGESEESARLKQEDIMEANSGFRDPDLSILLDIPVEESLKRIDKRGGTKEVFENRKTLEAAYNIYKDYFEDDSNWSNTKKRCVVDATQTPEKVTKEIIRQICANFGGN